MILLRINADLKKIGVFMSYDQTIKLALERLAWFASLQNHNSAECALKAREFLAEITELMEQQETTTKKWVEK